MRIVSLLPSATEIVCAVGRGGELVGVSHECDFPEAVHGLPVLTRSRIAVDASSAQIDARVRAALVDALSIYAIDAERLGALAPDVIVTQDLCEVCAVSQGDVRAAVARLAHRDDVRIVSLSPTTLAGVLDDVMRVGEAIGRDARPVRAALQARLDAIAGRAAHLPRRRVATIEWLEPIMLGGTWMPELVALAGGDAIGVPGGAGSPAPTVTLAELAALEPEVIVIKPCGFTLARSRAEPALLDRLAALAPRVYLADGNAFFNRPGPRLVESCEILAACTHPDAFADFAAAHATAFTRVTRSR